jgi:hypothetical protein
MKIGIKKTLFAEEQQSDHKADFRHICLIILLYEVSSFYC